MPDNASAHEYQYDPSRRRIGRRRRRSDEIPVHAKSQWSTLHVLVFTYLMGLIIIGSPTAAMVEGALFSSAATDNENQVQPTTKLGADATPTNSPYAYAFVLGAINEAKPSYKGFIYSTLVSVRILRRLGSTADCHVFARLSPESNRTTLPEEDMRMFAGYNISVTLLPKLHHESFTQLQYDKFELTQMTQYKRVLYLDADVMPLVNFDMFMKLSDPDCVDAPTLLKPNMIYATRGEPSNGGMFMLEPLEGDSDMMEEIVRKQHEQGQKLPYPHFDKIWGWGHSFIEANDFWEGIRFKYGRRWAWHAAHADQGLLYYFAKYAKKDVSIIIGDRIQSWTETGSSKRGNLRGSNDPFQESDTPNTLMNYVGKPLLETGGCAQTGQKLDWTCHPPYNGWVHFYGKTKPWQNSINVDQINNPNFGTFRSTGQAKVFWYRELAEVSRELDLGIDLTKWNEEYLPIMQESPLGYMPMWKDQGTIMNATLTK